MNWFLYDISLSHERVKLSSATTTTTLQELFNESLSNCEFSNKLKLADITPVFKIKNSLDKANYRPVSVLPPISKIYEKLSQKNISNYIENIFSPYLYGYRKVYSAQHALIFLIEKWKKILDEKWFCGTL